jgi:hypothetical protein
VTFMRLASSVGILGFAAIFGVSITGRAVSVRAGMGRAALDAALAAKSTAAIRDGNARQTVGGAVAVLSFCSTTAPTYQTQAARGRFPMTALPERGTVWARATLAAGASVARDGQFSWHARCKPKRMRSVWSLGLFLVFGCAGRTASVTEPGGATAGASTAGGSSPAGGGGLGGALAGAGGGADGGVGGGLHCAQGLMSVPPSGACDFPGECRPLKPDAQVCCPPGGCGPTADYFDCSCGANRSLLCVDRFDHAQNPTTCVDGGATGGEAGAGGQAGAAGQGPGTPACPAILSAAACESGQNCVSYDASCECVGSTWVCRYRDCPFTNAPYDECAPSATQPAGCQCAFEVGMGQLTASCFCHETVGSGGGGA